MNKKDLSAFRRQFKTDSYCLKISELYIVYMKKDNQNILHAEHASFEMKSEAEQEIHLGNFRKILTGGLDSKLFELDFDGSIQENAGQAICLQLLNTEQTHFVDSCNALLKKLADHYSYDNDIVVSFAKGKYNKPAGRKGRGGIEDSLDGFDDTSFGFKFVLCTISKADDMKRGVYYSAASERFELSSSLDKEISFSAPLEGFVYPAIGDFGSDVNKLLYYTAKANIRNESFLENVLNCRYELTAKEEKERFEEILRRVCGDKIKPEILKNIYDAVNEKLETYAEDDEPVALGAVEVRNIFEESGIRDLNGFDDAFHQAAEKGFEFKAANLTGGNTCSMRINSSVADINVNLEDLSTVRQIINARGRKCLEIELGDDAEINGIPLETERPLQPHQNV